MNANHHHKNTTNYLFQDALKLLLEANELEDWAPKILRTLWDFGGTAAALRFYRAYLAPPSTPPHSLSLEDAAVCVNILMANGFVQEAIEFQRGFVSGGKWEDDRSARNKRMQTLLFHVYRHCIADRTFINDKFVFINKILDKYLQQLFQLHLNDLEDQCLQHYLAIQGLTNPRNGISQILNSLFILIY